MLVKYRVNEVAKDFGKTSKEVLSVLQKHLNSERRACQTLRKMSSTCCLIISPGELCREL